MEKKPGRIASISLKTELALAALFSFALLFGALHASVSIINVYSNATVNLQYVPDAYGYVDQVPGQNVELKACQPVPSGDSIGLYYSALNLSQQLHVGGRLKPFTMPAMGCNVTGDEVTDRIELSAYSANLPGIPNVVFGNLSNPDIARSTIVPLGPGSGWLVGSYRADYTQTGHILTVNITAAYTGISCKPAGTSLIGTSNSLPIVSAYDSNGNIIGAGKARVRNSTDILVDGTAAWIKINGMPPTKCGGGKCCFPNKLCPDGTCSWTCDTTSLGAGKYSPQTHIPEIRNSTGGAEFVNSTILLGFVNSTAPDSTSVTYDYSWYRNGVLINSGSAGKRGAALVPGMSYNIANLTPAIAGGLIGYANWTFEAVASDGPASCEPVNSSTIETVPMPAAVPQRNLTLPLPPQANPLPGTGGTRTAAPGTTITPVTGQQGNGDQQQGGQQAAPAVQFPIWYPGILNPLYVQIPYGMCDGRPAIVYASGNDGKIIQGSEITVYNIVGGVLKSVPISKVNDGSMTFTPASGDYEVIAGKAGYEASRSLVSVGACGGQAKCVAQGYSCVSNSSCCNGPCAHGTCLAQGATGPAGGKGAVKNPISVSGKIAGGLGSVCLGDEESFTVKPQGAQASVFLMAQSMRVPQPLSQNGNGSYTFYPGQEGRHVIAVWDGSGYYAEFDFDAFNCENPGQCKNDNEGCSNSLSCCSGACSAGGICQKRAGPENCASKGRICADSGQCCQGDCVSGKCSMCSRPLETCTANSDCCEGTCSQAGRCVSGGQLVPGIALSSPICYLPLWIIVLALSYMTYDYSRKRISGDKPVFIGALPIAAGIIFSVIAGIVAGALLFAYFYLLYINTKQRQA